jgi:hypothetical protein
LINIKQEKNLKVLEAFKGLQNEVLDFDRVFYFNYCWVYAMSRQWCWGKQISIRLCSKCFKFIYSAPTITSAVAEYVIFQKEKFFQQKIGQREFASILFIDFTLLENIKNIFFFLRKREVLWKNCLVEEVMWSEKIREHTKDVFGVESCFTWQSFKNLRIKGFLNLRNDP